LTHHCSHTVPSRSSRAPLQLYFSHKTVDVELPTSVLHAALHHLPFGWLIWETFCSNCFSLDSRRRVWQLFAELYTEVLGLLFSSSSLAFSHSFQCPNFLRDTVNFRVTFWSFCGCSLSSFAPPPVFTQPVDLSPPCPPFELG